MRVSISADQILEEFRMAEIRNDILKWWNSTGQRHFPWRETRDPYSVLVAEILLHRTKAEQVVPLYQAFLRKYPDIDSIAQTSPDALSESFHSAGLYWRWKSLHSMAVDIATRFNGQIPQYYEDLTSLPGVSHYIASAVRCFALGHPDVLLDTNTVRVAGRIFGLTITDASRRSRLFRDVLERFIDPENPREFNFSLLDFGAVICKPKLPMHQNCPVSRYCSFYKQEVDATQKVETSIAAQKHTSGKRGLNVTGAR